MSPVNPVRAILTALLIAVVLGTGAFVAGTRFGDGLSHSEGFGIVEDTFGELRERAAVEVSEHDLARAAIQGMLEALDDPYASYLSPAQAREVEDLLEDSIVGIGVWLEEAGPGLRVTALVDGAPADDSGLEQGDIIVGVDGHPTRGLTVAEAAAFVRGPVGSTVRLNVRRGGERLEFSVERSRIEAGDVQARMLGDGVGYARLMQFGRGAADELRRALRGLLDDGATRVVLDLRHNAGGLADEAVGVASLFLDGGIVARLRERGRPERELPALGEPLSAFPLVVLVDGATASASEVVAGALQDRGRAQIVGTRTFGKGSVLALSDLDAEAQIQYTSGFFLTPRGRAIEGVGITPDVRVLPRGPEDAQLDRALELLRR